MVFIKGCCCMILLATAPLLLVSSSAFAFVTPGGVSVHPPRATTTRLLVAPELFTHAHASNMWLAEMISDDYGKLAKAVVIALAFGGGLIPALIAGNKSMMQTLAGKRRGGEASLEDTKDPSKSLDPTLIDSSIDRQYIEDSGASGPEIPQSSLLFANEKIPLVDIVAIMGRIGNKDSIADWEDLPSTKVPDLELAVPPMWLPRSTYKVNVRNAPFLGWPINVKTGEPVGGVALKEAEEARISKEGALIGDAALDAVFDSWSWGASVATPDKVENQLSKWRPNEAEFDLGKFTGAAIYGRSLTGLAAFTFILIQVIAFGTFFLGPILRSFFDVDIGFGKMGTCDPETCLKLWNGP